MIGWVCHHQWKHEPFVKKRILFPRVLLLPVHFWIWSSPLSEQSFHQSIPETLKKTDTTYFLPFFLFLLVQETIPQEQEMWNYNSVRDKWYVALLWIINESRRALVLPSRPSVIQTVWHKQARSQNRRRHTYTRPSTCKPVSSITSSLPEAFLYTHIPVCFGFF